MAFDEHDEEARDMKRTAQRRFADFDCPTCNANNPRDETFGNGEEVRCYYCGEEFRAVVNEEGRLRLKEL